MKQPRKIALALAGLFFLALTPLSARIELVTLPRKEGVKLTIYNSRDLTLVKENRNLSFKKGLNRLEFSWAGTLIDPTSLIFRALQQEDQLEILDVSYPKNAADTLVWNIDCKKEGLYPIELSYFTAGLSWKAKYLMIADANEKNMALKLFIQINNSSGEDYLNATTRLVVGKVNLVEDIASLARRPAVPMSAPQVSFKDDSFEGLEEESRVMSKGARRNELFAMEKAMSAKPKQVIKEGLSEYFLYSIEGEEDFQNAWGKKLINLEKPKIAFQAFYKYDTDQWGENIRRFYRFFNKKEASLGEEPLPDGAVIVYRCDDQGGRLKFVEKTQVRYIPVDEKIDLDLGYEKQITLKKRLKDYKTDEFTFDYRGNVEGWNEHKFYELEIKNLRNCENSLEIKEHFPGKWDVENLSSDTGVKDDLRTLKYDLILKPFEERKVVFKIIQYQGKNAENK